MRARVMLAVALAASACRTSGREGAEASGAEPAPSAPTAAVGALAAPRRVPIVVGDDAYLPAQVGAAPGEVVHLVFTRESAAPCAERVVVDGATTALPLDAVAVVPVRAPASGRLSFACPGGRLSGAVVVTTQPVDPGLEHPLIGHPLPLDYAAALVGRPAPEWTVKHWDGTAPLTMAALRGRVVVVRFFMDECPFCRATLPALAELRRELADRPVTFVGLFHSKPRGTESDWATARDTARRWGADFVLGYDPLWTTLERWYGAERLSRAPTSVTFVIDRGGRFAFVHPGPVFHPSRHPDHARCDADYGAVRAAILAALGR